jgi:nucleotide-binding universal stress UspA family protein
LGKEIIIYTIPTCPFCKAAKEGVVLHTNVVAGHEVETIVDYAKDHHFDLVVIGFMGHSKIYGRIWGSTSQNIARLVPCTVMVVK